MSNSRAKSPARSADREERLAKALRANLKRRKAKARAEAATAPEESETPRASAPPRPILAQKPD